MNEKGKFLSMPPSLKKIVAPPLPSVIVHREALIQRLNEAMVGDMSVSLADSAHYKLILIEAPAGYGKTTLLAEFAQQSSILCCWYFLDRSDTEPLTFLRTLLASLQQGFPSFGAQLASLLNAATGTGESNFPDTFLEALLEALANETSQRFALLLCNYQEVNAYPEITHLVAYLLDHLPEQGVLVLESREVPELDFASLLARRAMVGLGRELLRFSPQEIRSLAQVQRGRVLSEDEAERLARAFDGWITGLLLGTRLGDVQFLQRSWNDLLPREKQSVQIHAQTLFSYVVNEVFKHHQEVYAFLREAIIVQEMTPALCSELLGLALTEAGQRLQYLEQHGLFVTYSGVGEQAVYSCHPTLRDLLYEELRQQNLERFRQLHQRAAELLSASQRYEQAIYHALEAKRDEFAAQLIIAAAEQMLEQGQMETLQQWISAFSEETLVCYPRLLLIQADIFLRRSEVGAALPLLEHLTELLSARPSTLANPEEMPLLQAELAIIHAHALNQQGQYAQAQQLCQHVLTYLPADEVILRARAHLYFGSCAQFLGDLTTKITHYQKALQLWGRHTVSYLTADGHDSLAGTYAMLGHFALAEHHSARATACWEQLQNIPGMVNHLITRANIKWDQGRFDEAEHLLQQALTLASSPPRLRCLQGYALVNLGEFYRDQGFYNRSLALTEEGLALARQLGAAYLLNYALMTLSLTYLYMGDAATASLLLSEISQTETQEGSTRTYQQVLRDVAQGTIWLHQRRYSEARDLLESANAALTAIAVKREQLMVLVRLAACYLWQKRPVKTFERLSEVERILTSVDHYEQRVCAEVRVFPHLQRAIKRRPEAASLRTLLHWPSEPGEPEPAPRNSESERSATPASSPVVFLAQPEAPRLKILALGEPGVLLDGQPITCWRMARAMELCFYLLECGQPVRKEQILAALWGETDDRVFQTFYSTIHYLRKALGGESAIASRTGFYTLDLSTIYGEGGVWYDVAAFEEQHALGKQALTERADELAQTAFEDMTKLYRGDYVQPFYSDWCTARRDELRRLYLDACQQLALLAWRKDKIEESAAYWQQILAIDACSEEAHTGLMRCYMRQGKRGLALRQYQYCAEMLRLEWGAVPGATLQNLYRRLMGLSKATAGLS
ncbi:MAG TPA: BTAD domain-containing putative transcriptional regulator [Ktedonobacteraceae bacterium]|nr:BTAD domain-containing putative transcriptional regulator [Ktedonobacteraceae bacterium]